MRTDEIQSRIDAIAKGMAAKALPQAYATFEVRSHRDERFGVILGWSSGDRNYADKHEFFSGPIEKVLAEAAAHVAALPSPEQARMTAFMAALGEAIELGKKVDVDADLVNPLVALMKRLSKNALQHSPHAEAL